jgi:hypothetical protein
MATNRITSTLSAFTAAAVGLTGGLASPASAQTRPASAQVPTRQVVAHSYGWPVKPFDRQHPVRGFFGDPRIAEADGATTKQFHFGVDVSAPNGTPIYATITGTVSLINPGAISVAGAGGVTFEYWHIIPTVRSGQRVTAYRTVVGNVEKPWAHVHFSERVNGVYVNPLRPGGMGPFADDTTPRVESIDVRISHGVPVVTADVADDTPLVVPAPWSDLPVMPALVRWRVTGLGATKWQTIVDFRLHIPRAPLFASVYGSATRQNHAARPGLYRVVLGRLGKASSGDAIEVEVRDAQGNRSVATLVRG